MSLFYIKDPVLQIPVLSGKTVTETFFRNDELRKLKTICQIRRPKNGLKLIILLHDNAPEHKACVVT